MIQFYEFLVDQYHMHVVGAWTCGFFSWDIRSRLPQACHGILALLGIYSCLWNRWAKKIEILPLYMCSHPTHQHMFSRWNNHSAGWSVKTYQESDSNDRLGQQPQQHVKDLHPHAIVTATPSETQSSVINTFTQLGPLPKAVQKSFQFVDAPLSDSIDADINEGILEMSLDFFFQEYGLMDPELSATWDEDHGLKAKRAWTASVSQFISSELIFVLITFSYRTIQCCSGGITVVIWHWMRCYGLRDEACTQIQHVENVQPFVPLSLQKLFQWPAVLSAMHHGDTSL